MAEPLKINYCSHNSRKIIKPMKYYRVFDNGFACIVDSKGFIFIRDSQTRLWESPCMYYCYMKIMHYNLAVAKAVLALSCEIQNDKSVTERATLYESF